MKDYHVKIKVRNNRLLQAIYDAGGEPGFKWCHANGLKYNNVNLLLNMTDSPIDKRTKDYTNTAMQLCMVLNKSPADLWSEAQLIALDKNTSQFEMSHEEVKSLMGSQKLSYIQDFDSFELKEVMQKAIADLTDKEQEVIRMHFFDGLTLDEIGERFGITKERIRQIEAKALRKLRHPTKSDNMRYFLIDSDVYHEDKQRKLEGAKTKIIPPLLRSKYESNDNWWDSIGEIVQ